MSLLQKYQNENVLLPGTLTMGQPAAPERQKNSFAGKGLKQLYFIE